MVNLPAKVKALAEPVYALLDIPDLVADKSRHDLLNCRPL